MQFFGDGIHTTCLLQYIDLNSNHCCIYNTVVTANIYLGEYYYLGDFYSILLPKHFAVLMVN